MNNTFTGPKPTPLTGVTPGAATFNSAGAVALKPPYFTDKKVLITGASSGLGMALAYYYLNNGAQVALVGRDVETLTNIGKQFPT